MELKDIASVSGKSGLYKVFKPTRTGVILESLDKDKKKMIANANNRVSMLHEISIYTHTEEGATPLGEVLTKIHDEFGDDIGLNSSSSPEELRSFMKHLLPDFDEDRVYASDIKKLINWYEILQKEAPEVLLGTNGDETKESDDKPSPPKKSKKPKKDE